MKRKIFITSIFRYVNTFYNAIFNKNNEKYSSVNNSVFNQAPYETEIQFVINSEFKNIIKVAILGNSISLHGVIEGLWDHESGMAASNLEHDYVHILMNNISNEKQSNIEYIVINISDFERDFENFQYNRLEKIKKFEPDIIVFQIGENLSTEMLKLKGEIFVENYRKLINYCNGKETIICIPFWPVKEKINLITEVALNEKVYIVDLSHLGSGIDALNIAKSEKKYNHAGVAAHPGDYGMKNIAKILYITINKIID
jgi:hypothetical protein